MTQDEIIEMAKMAGMRLDKHNGGFVDASEIKRFAKLVAAKEREACAKLCESLFDLEDDTCNEAEQCAAAIRARGESK